MAETRATSELKVLRNRARHRAVQILAKRHPEELAELVEREYRVAVAEAEMLKSMAPVPEGANTVLLRPGRRMPTEQPVNRIDTATCRRCHTSHDRGHVCPSCGSTEEEADD